MVVVPDTGVSFQIVSNDEDVVRKVAIYSKDRPDMKITRVETSNPSLLEVKAEPMSADDAAYFKVEAGWAVTVTLKATAKLGEFNEELVVWTDHPAKPDVKKRITGKVTGPITFTPEKVVIHDANVTEGGSASLLVWVRGRSATITVEKAPPGLDVSFTPMAMPAGVKGSKFKMNVKILPGTNAAQISDVIVLKTDHPNASEIRIPVDALIQNNN